MDGVEYKICQTQAEIYERIANEGYDVKIFSELYLRSDFCKRAFDTIYSRFQWADDLECLDFIMPEIGKDCKKLKKEHFDDNIAYWIGFTYRQLYIETGIQSEILQERISFDIMCRYYPGLHTVDEEMATDIICKDFKLHKLNCVKPIKK